MRSPSFRSTPLTLLVLTLAGALSGGSARAQSLTLTLDSVTPLTTVAGHSGTVDFVDLAGRVNFTVTDRSGNTGNLPGQLSLFCVELGQDIYIGSSGNAFSLVNLALADSGVNPAGLSANIAATGIGSVRAQYLEALYAHVFPAGYTPTALSNSDASAFQLAVWELSHDTDFNLTAGSSPHFWITTTGTAVTQAQTWVSWVADNYVSAPLMSLQALHSASLQDFILPTSNNFLPIPEPPLAATMAGVLAASLAFLGRREPLRQPRPVGRRTAGASAGTVAPVSIFRIPG